MFTNKVVLVTGGTKGIGASVVSEFLCRGACVVAVYSNDDHAAQKMKDGLHINERDRIFLYKGSVTDIDFLQHLFRDIEIKFGKLNILINSAGIAKDNLFLDMEEDQWSRVVITNLKGTLNTSLLAAEVMRKNTDLCYIINFSSISGIHGRAAQANYACSKGAVIGITKLLAKKFIKDHIFVNAVVPGLIMTEMIEKMSEEKKEEVIAATLLKRMGEAKEVAKTILSLVGGDFSYTNGTCIKVDGGYLK